MTKKKRRTPTQIHQKRLESDHQSFGGHLKELRQRLFYIAISVVIFSSAAYFVQQHLVSLLLKPAKGVGFIYTSPGGGISFLFEVCLYVGIAFSIPVIMFNIIAFIEPALTRRAREILSVLFIWSAILAALGMALGYIFGLPLALRFLTHQFTTTRIKPLFTIQEYMSFVTIYMVGSALIFQIPLIVMLINKIKPLKPRKLLKYEKWIIAFAFLASAIMAPTINLLDQLVIAIPIIVVYQIAILMVWFSNRNGRHSQKVKDLMARDESLQAERSKVGINSLTPLDKTLATQAKSSEYGRLIDITN